LTAEGMSQRQVGDVLGVDEKTIRRDAANAAAAEQDHRQNNDGGDDNAANAAAAECQRARDVERAGAVTRNGGPSRIVPWCVASLTR
jgi:hypothetical protein